MPKSYKTFNKTNTQYEVRSRITEDVTVYSDDDDPDFSLCYACFCLLNITLIQISLLWTKSCLNAMFGYGVKGLDTDPYYSIAYDVEGFDAQTYGSLVGFWYSILFCPSLLFVSPLTENWNRKMLIGGTCFVWGLCSFLNGFCTTIG